MDTLRDCVFCQIATGQAPAKVIFKSHNVIGIVPLNPVVEGHVIFMPRYHTRDALGDIWTTGHVMKEACIYASQIAVGSCNIITSVGEAATQSVFHLHIHIVPRREGDGLKLPWTGQVP
jgi:histidine triad (HIT) family protein